MEAPSKLSRRSFLRLLGMGTVSSAALGFSGCSEFFGPRTSSQRVVGLSLAKHLVVENIGNSAVGDMRMSFSVDFQVGGQAENAFNWVDGYPILEARLPGQWSWGIATPVDFDILDTKSPFGLDPDAFSFQDTQGQLGDFSTTFVFRRRTMEPGESWRIPLLYLAAENDLGLIQIYRNVLPIVESFEMPTTLTPNGHADYVTVVDKEEKIQVHVNATRLSSPIERIEGFPGKNTAAPNPIYQEGLGAKYETGAGQIVFVSSASPADVSIQVDPPPAGAEKSMARQICGELQDKQLKWRWCMEAPMLWYGV